MEKGKKPPVKKPNDTPELVMSERFTGMVLKEFGSNFAGQLRVTDFQRQLIQGYFICIDRTIKTSEKDRVRKNANNKDHAKYDNNLAYTWKNVNLHDLSMDIIHYAKMGLDMLQDNHLYPILFKNRKEQKYDVELMKGYNGIQYIAEKYAVEPPISVNVELVYSLDTFTPLKKNKDNRIEGYDFKINDAFNRGEIIGGFGYIEYVDPLKNKLILMTIKDILKRKPSYAAAQFWGGPSKKWVNGVQKEVQIEGWATEMYLKTVKREVFSAKNIPLDPKKIDDSYHHMRMRETKQAEILAQAEIDNNANTDIIDVTATTQPAQDGIKDPEKEKEKSPEGDRCCNYEDFEGVEISEIEKKGKLAEILPNGKVRIHEENCTRKKEQPEQSEKKEGPAF